MSRVNLIMLAISFATLKAMSLTLALRAILNFINANGAVVGVITFGIGLMGGNWLAIGRDRRKEFNDVATQLQVFLRRQLELNREGRLGSGQIEHEEFIRLGILMSNKKRKRFEGAVRRYEESFRQSGEVRPDGSWKLTNLSVVIDATTELLDFCRLK